MLWLFLLPLFLCATGQDANELFAEELVVTPLPTGELMAHLEFTLHRNFTSQTVSHFNLFPKSIGQIALQYQAQEIHLTFTQGRWRHDSWGYPISSSPNGVAFLAWFDPSIDVDQAWKGLQRAFGGLFCASLNHMDQAITSVPKFVFQPQGDLFSAKTPNRTEDRLRYSVITREAVCTENLTPFLKLLPCHQKQGIASLLKYPKKLLASSFYSMGMHLQSKCLGPGDKCNSRRLELALRFTVVFDTPKKATQLQTFFGVPQGIKPCPVATYSNVYVATPQAADQIKVRPLGQPMSTIPSKGLVKSYESINLFQLSGSSLTLEIDVLEPHFSIGVPIQINRYVTTDGSKSDGLVLHVVSNFNETVDLTIFQMIPWYLRLYFHTITITINDVRIPTSKVFNSDSDFQIIPGQDQRSPSILEFKYSVPPNSVFSLSIQYDKALLHWTKYPPDPNRGFDIGPATVLVKNNQTTLWRHCPPLIFSDFENRDLPLYTTGQAVMLPLPDFSMPYNVITITCTILALFFRQMVNELTLRYGEVWTGLRSFQPQRPTTQIFRFLTDNRVINFIFEKLG